MGENTNRGVENHQTRTNYRYRLKVNNGVFNKT